MNYTKLFDYFYDEHGLSLLESDMQQIVRIVNEMQAEAKVNDCLQLIQETHSIEANKRAVILCHLNHQTHAMIPESGGIIMLNIHEEEGAKVQSELLNKLASELNEPMIITPRIEHTGMFYPKKHTRAEKKEWKNRSKHHSKQ